LDSLEPVAQNVAKTSGDIQIRKSHAVIPTVKDNTPSSTMVSEKVKRSPTPRLGKDSSKVSPLLEFHAHPSRDIQSLLDGETMLTSLLLVFSVSNHIASQVSLIHQLTH
tara:strand:+ start:356 stop:682 length:327 start_codon:yes stop_codon:yes gene_type:complete